MKCEWPMRHTGLTEPTMYVNWITFLYRVVVPCIRPGARLYFVSDCTMSVVCDSRYYLVLLPFVGRCMWYLLARSLFGHQVLRIQEPALEDSEKRRVLSIFCIECTQSQTIDC